MNPGGPGGSGVELVREGAAQTIWTPEVLARFDVVGFDPRGVGASAPIRCFASDEDEAAFFGTTPFFPPPHGQQGNRLQELLATHPIETYLLNTGGVGGTDGDDRSKKLRIPDTSACVKGIA